MKCIQTYPPNSDIQRVTDDKAYIEVHAGRAMYIPRRVWKEKVRDNTDACSA